MSTVRIRSLRCRVFYAVAAMGVLSCASASVEAPPEVAVVPDDTGQSWTTVPWADLEGEGALHVVEHRGRLEVRWITARAEPGQLEVLLEGQIADRVVTSPSTAHLAQIPAPSAERVVLRYGVEGGATHETEVGLAHPSPADLEILEADSLYLVGDTHGEIGALEALLRNAGVIDGGGRWAAGGAHIVFLGDLMGRGPDVTRLLWLVYRLEREARAAGGGVHVLLGNHEIMVMLEDLRYAHPKELSIADAYGIPYSNLFDIETTVLGRWLASKPAIMKIDDVLLAHGGVSSDYLRYSLESHRDSLTAFMDEELWRHWADTTVVVVRDSALADAARDLPGVTGTIVLDSAAYDRRVSFFWDDRSVFWYRDYVQSDSVAGELARVLDHFDAKAHAVAHTPTATGAHQRFGGTLIATHAPSPATQLVLLVRDEGGYSRYRFGLDGPPEPLPLHELVPAPAGIHEGHER